MTAHCQSWQWGSQFGGLTTGPNNDNPDESIRDVITDNQGNVYFCGTVRQPSTANGNVITTYGKYDIIVGKFDCHGNLIWQKTAGSDFDEFANAIYLDASFNIYLTGYIEADPIYTCNLFGSIINDNTSDLFITKMDSAGNVMWNKIGAPGFPQLLSSGLHFKSGLNNTIDIVFYSASDGELFPGDSVTQGWWLANLDTSGTILSKFQITPDVGAFHNFDFASGANGEHYFVSNFGQGWDSASVGGQKIYTVIPGNDDVVFFKFDNSNNLEWLHQIGDTTFRFLEGNKIIVSGNDVYVSGSAFNGVIIGNDTLFNTIGAFNKNFPFLAKYNSLGIAQWGINMSSTFNCEMPGGMTEMPNGNIAFSGYFINAGQIDTFNVTGSGQEIFIGEITPNRNLVSIVTFPSGLRDYPQALTSDTTGNIYLAGAFSDSYTVNGNTYTYEGGKTDGFVAKFGYICTTGLDELFSNASSIQLYPNPASDLINVQTLINEQLEIVVLNSLGEVVYKNLISESNSEKFSLRIDQLSPGFYILQISDGNRSYATKFLKLEE